MQCSVAGRRYSADHPVCVSCVRQLGACRLATKKKPRRSKEDINSWSDGVLFCTTKYLYSSNVWHGRPRYVYIRERDTWQRVLMAAPWRPMDRGHLTIRRYVASARQLIADRDNLIAACKPVRDSIVRLGLLPDDNDKVMTFEITQEIDRKFPRVEMTLEEL